MSGDFAPDRNPDDAYLAIPLETLEALDRYLVHGTHPGMALYAVLSNSLVGAMSYGDEKFRAALYPVVHYLYNRWPSMAWGSPERCEEWAKLTPSDRASFYRHYPGHVRYLALRRQRAADSYWRERTNG